MDCQACPLGSKKKPTIRRQQKFEKRLKIVMSHPPFTFLDVEDFECHTVQLLKRWIDVEFDVVFVFNCLEARRLDRKEEDRLPAIAATARAAAKCCSSTLQSDLASGDVVVLCGNTVLDAFGLRRKVTDLVGWVEKEKGVSYLATYCPVDVEDYPVDKWKDFVWTIQRAEAIIKGEAPDENKAVTSDWVDLSSLSAFEEYVDQIRDGEILSVDLETSGLEYWDPEKEILQIGISPVSENLLPAVIGPGCFNADGFVDVWNRLCHKVKFLGQNHKFDYCFLKSKIPDAEFKIHYDLRMIHHLIDERTGTHGLGRMLQVYCNWKDYWSGLEVYLKQKGGYKNAPYADLAKYLALDLIGAARLFKVFISMLEDKKQPSPYRWPCLMGQREQLEVVYAPLSNVLAQIELRGNTVSREALESLRDEVEPKVDAARKELEGQIFDKTGVDYSVDSPAQLLTALKQLGILAPTCTSVDKRILVDHMDHDLVREVLKYRADKKLLDAFIIGSLTKLVELEGGECRLMCAFDPVGTIGSRWSCRNPNLMQLPKKGNFKKIFIPSKEGRIIVQNDFSALEARVAAYLSGDEALRDGCLGDLHTMVSKRSFRKYLNAVDNTLSTAGLLNLLSSQGVLLPAYKACQAFGGALTLEKGRDIAKDHLRNCAKVITYGIFFGRGARALAVQELRCSVEEAQFFIDEYFKLFPKLHAWINYVHKLVETGGIIEEPGGLRRDLRGWMFSCDPQNRRRFLAGAKRKAVNFMTQTFGGNIQNVAFVKTARYLEEQGIGFMRMGVHDSMVYEIDLNSDTRYHLAKIRELQQVIKNPSWLAVTDTECGYDYGSLMKEERFFELLDGKGLV